MNTKTEIEAFIQNLITTTNAKDIDQLMNLYADNPEFKIIFNDGSRMNYQQLKEFYGNYFDALLANDLLENNIEVVPIDVNNAVCIWQGKENTRLNSGKSTITSWTSMMLLRKQFNEWKINQMQVSHY